MDFLSVLGSEIEWKLALCDYKSILKNIAVK